MPASLIDQTLLNQYRVDTFIASGGMGAVYRVWDLKRNVPLAMKVLHSELAEDPHIFKRFKREANALKKLTHPHIVQFYGLYQSPDFSFLLERYIDGPSLKDIIRQQSGKPLSVQDTLVFLKAVGSALGYAHANGVIHCDVKPGNVLVDQGGNIYLTDFGIARHAESTTTTMGTAGTAAYMAPEQIRGEAVTPATDVYALGVMLFEMLTGQRPFRGNESGTEQGGDTANERIRYAHLHLSPPNPRSINPSISMELSQVILQSMSKNIEGRFSDIQNFFKDLFQALKIDPDIIGDRVKLEDSFSFKNPSPPIDEIVTIGSTGFNWARQPKYLFLFGGIIGVFLLAWVMIQGGRPYPGLLPTPSESSPESQFTQTGVSPVLAATPMNDVLEPIPTTAPTITPIPNTITSSTDNAQLIRIPAGKYWRGLSEEQVNDLLAICPNCQRDYISDEMPERQIYLDEFWMDQTEVTNAQFSQFVSETGYLTSAEQKIHQTSYVFKLELNDFKFDGSANWRHPHGTSSNISGLDTVPVTQVSWEDADAYCQWAERRLPTEAEWEKAARGTDGQLFVWGNELPSSQFLNFNLSFYGPRPVGSYSDGVSPYGLYDMAGNLWEWVADFYDENYFQNSPDRNPAGPPTGDGHSLRGGSWASEYRDMYLITSTSRLWNRPYVSSSVLGFRCATNSP